MREWPAQRLSESEARQMEAMATLGRVMCIFISRTSDVVSGDTLQCVAVCCSVLQCVAVCCSVLQCVAEAMATLVRVMCIFISRHSNSVV